MHLTISLTYISTIVGIVIIGIITSLHRKDRSITFFSSFSFLLAFWLGLQFFAQTIPKNLHLSLLLLQTSSVIANFIVYAFLAFVAQYTKFNGSYIKHVIRGSLIISGLLILPNYSQYMIREVSVSLQGIAIQDAGLLYYFQLGFDVVVLVIGLVILIRSTVKKQVNQRAKDYYLILALAQAMFISFLSVSVFASNQASQIFIPLSLFVMVGVVSVAIVRHRLFDIRLIVARASAYILSLATLVGVFIASMYAISIVFFGESGVNSAVRFAYAVAAVVIAYIMQPTKRFFDRITNKIFYRDSYDTQQVLDRFGSVIVGNVEVDQLTRGSLEVIDGVLHPEVLTMCIVDSDKRKYIHFNDQNNLEPEELSYLLDKSTVFPVIFEDEEKETIVKKILIRNHIEVIMKLQTHQGTVGFLLLGEKKNGSVYGKQDIKLLNIISDELAVAAQNALRFEEIQRFNETLQDKIDDATKELRKTNQKLKALDEAKDEFISMASHQLRTPLTSVKGYLSMVLDGDAGKLTPVQHQLLEQAFSSSQRMVYLIADLLNVSRLRTGKFVIETKPTFLPSLIEGEVKQLQETAHGRQLQLQFSKPEKFPTLMLDETKIRQVVMNFIDNAIYYTPPGGHIFVKLEETPQSVQYTVTDTGIGVPKAEQHHLFTKFYRAGNARKARPDGTGLGLFMAKKVIIAQGGSVIVKSEEGRGSTFGFIFPKAKLETKEQAVSEL